MVTSRVGRNDAQITQYPCEAALLLRNSLSKTGGVMATLISFTKVFYRMETYPLALEASVIALIVIQYPPPYVCTIHTDQKCKAQVSYSDYKAFSFDWYCAQAGIDHTEISDGYIEQLPVDWWLKNMYLQISVQLCMHLWRLWNIKSSFQKFTALTDIFLIKSTVNTLE